MDSKCFWDVELVGDIANFLQNFIGSSILLV